jgi:hypothetical protein
MHDGTLGVPLKGSVKVPRSIDQGAKRSEIDEVASFADFRDESRGRFVKTGTVGLDRRIGRETRQQPLGKGRR